MILWLDCETRRPVVPKNGQLQFGIEYAENWQDYAGMGIACCCVLNSTGRQYVYGQENITELQQSINHATKIVTHNGEAFDFPLLEHFGLIIPRAKSRDLCAMLEAQAGRRIGLAAYAERNLNAGKTMSGALAPILWQEAQRENDLGKVLRIVDYCQADVNLTFRLYKLALTRGYLLHPYNGRKIYLENL